MKRIIIITAVALLAVPAFAQAPAPPSQEEVNALLQAVAAQRDSALNQNAQLIAKLTVTSAEVDKLKAAAEACKPKADKK